MNTITIQNTDGTFTVFNADVTTTAYDGSQQPTPIFTGTLEMANRNLGLTNDELTKVQESVARLQAVVDAITNFDPATVATQVDSFKNTVAKTVKNTTAQTITP